MEQNNSVPYTTSTPLSLTASSCAVQAQDSAPHTGGVTPFRSKKYAPNKRMTAEQYAYYLTIPRPVGNPSEYSRWWRAHNPEKWKAYKKKQSAPPVYVKKLCIVCGKDFSTQGRKRRFCGPACSTQFFREWNNRIAQNKTARKIKSHPPITCKGCQSIFCSLNAIPCKFCCSDCAGRYHARVHYHRRQTDYMRKKAVSSSHLILSYLKQHDLQAKCYYCLKTEKARLCEVDHIQALQNGGSNSDYNMVIACKSCNRLKHARRPIPSSIVTHGELEFDASKPLFS